MPLTTSSLGSEVVVSAREQLCSHLGYRFTDPAQLELALRHRSWCAENGSVQSNERLEFLGDSVLGLVVTDHLYRSAPLASEGVLARARSELVSSVALASVARSVDLGPAILLGKGEESTGGRDKTSILADAMEAVIGAIYLDGGKEAAGAVLLHILGDRIDEVLDGSLASDHKSVLQELVAHRFGVLPEYEIVDDGPEHDKRFEARVGLGSEVWGVGEGRTKKQAEQAAARQAYELLIDSADSLSSSPTSGKRPGEVDGPNPESGNA